MIVYQTSNIASKHEISLGAVLDGRRNVEGNVLLTKCEMKIRHVAEAVMFVLAA